MFRSTIEQLEHYADLRLKLAGLRHLLRSDEAHETLTYFDEELDANEFEVALHALCDFVLKHESTAVATRDIEAIELLHQKMELVDDCASQLRNRIG